MQPNDLPIVCLPMDLSDEGAAKLLEFLYAITEALEMHYAAQLIRYAHRHEPASASGGSNTSDTDPPF